MKRLLIYLIIFIGAISLAIWWFSPEQALKRRTNRLMEILSISQTATRPIRQAKVFSMNGLLSKELEIISPTIPDANGIWDQQEVESVFSWICENVRKSDFQVIEFLQVSIVGRTATTTVKVQGFMELPAYRPADGRYEVRVEWAKEKDSWRFHRVSWEVL